jgi:hypothetical protein
MRLQRKRRQAQAQVMEQQRTGGQEQAQVMEQVPT